MKSLRKHLSIVLFGLLLAGVSTGAMAQQNTEAYEAYNEARELAQQGNYDQAITRYEEALASAQEMGAEGEDIVTRVRNALPSVHFQKARQVYENNRQNVTEETIDEIIAAFQEAADAAEEYGNDQLQTQAAQVITQMHYQKATRQFSNQNLEASLQSVNTAIERNANYAKAYYLKAQILKNQEGTSLEEMVQAYDRAIEVGQQANDNTVVREANNSLAAELVVRGYEEMQDNDFAAATELYNRALEYNPSSAQAYYRLAEVYNRQAEWNQALQNAQQALENESGGRADQAKIYFEIGTAHKGLGNTAEACSAFTNAAYGDFQQSARYEIENELECEESN